MVDLHGGLFLDGDFLGGGGSWSGDEGDVGGDAESKESDGKESEEDVGAEVAALDGAGEGVGVGVAEAGEGGSGAADDWAPGVGEVAFEAVVDEDAEGVDVGGGGDGAAGELFGGGVAGGAEVEGFAVGEEGEFGGDGVVVGGEAFGDAEVDEDGGLVIGAAHEVGGFDVAVDPAVVVEVCEAVAEGEEEVGDGAVACGEDVGGEEFFGEDEAVVVGLEAVDGGEHGVSELSEALGFESEALGFVAGGVFECEGSVEEEVFAAVDFAVGAACEEGGDFPIVDACAGGEGALGRDGGVGAEEGVDVGGHGSEERFEGLGEVAEAANHAIFDLVDAVAGDVEGIGDGGGGFAVDGDADEDLFGLGGDGGVGEELAEGEFEEGVVEGGFGGLGEGGFLFIGFVEVGGAVVFAAGEEGAVADDAGEVIAEVSVCLGVVGVVWEGFDEGEEAFL